MTLQSLLTSCSFELKGTWMNFLIPCFYMQLYMKTEIMPLSHLSSAPVGGEKEITKGFGKAFSRNYNTSAQKHNP